MQRFSVLQGENMASPVVEQVGPDIRIKPPQPQKELRAVAPWLKPSSERFMKRNPSVFKGTVGPTVREEWVSTIQKIF